MQRIACRQHEARHAQAGAAQLLQQDEPIPVRQSPIKDQGLVRHLLDCGPCVVDAVAHVDADSCSHQGLAYQLGQSLMVFDQEYSAHQKWYV
jgi:hypothetical protein